MKINTLRIKGFRGVKNELSIPLNGKSIVLYGDNGTGKSSVTDSIEWFYYNKINHLSSTEINFKEAIKNYFTDSETKTEVEINFIQNKFNSTKGFLLKDSPKFSKNEEEFKKYIIDSQKENFILRHRDLGKFILSPKGDKLKELSDIIGFSEVTKKKELLGKIYRSINTEIKNQNFENQITTQKAILISKLSANVTSEENLISSINEKIKNLKLGFEVKEFDDINALLEKLKKPINKNLDDEYRILNQTKTELTNLKNEIEFINKSYTDYYNEFDGISKDIDSIMQTYLADLLDAGKIALNKYHKEDSCPLCLQFKKREELQNELEERLKEIEESANKKKKFDNEKKLIESIAEERLKRLDINFLKYFSSEDNKVHDSFETIKNRFVNFQKNAKIKVVSKQKLMTLESTLLKTSDFDFLTIIDLRIKKIEDIFKKDNTTQIFSDISSSKEAFINIKKYNKEKAILENQRKSLEIIYNQFIKVQKEGLETFIKNFSGKINEYYQFMNPGESFQDIRIATIGDEDNLDGLTIEFNFNGKPVSPPQAVFSESHLNCFGISFFLASVDAFNEINKFIVFDDVISSFDSNHRKRFSELLFEKSKKNQIILLTHEIDWFKNFVKPQAKTKGWLINELSWNETDGTKLDLTENDIKEKIENLLSEGNTELVGNLMRRYYENTLKRIAFNIKAKFEFRFNTENEHRMLEELFSRIRSQINEQSSDLKSFSSLYDRIQNSNLLTNTASHDNPFIFKIADLRAMWADFKELENLFFCNHIDCTKKEVSIKFFAPVDKKISCGCGRTKYDWKNK